MLSIFFLTSIVSADDFGQLMPLQFDEISVYETDKIEGISPSLSWGELPEMKFPKVKKTPFLPLQQGHKKWTESFDLVNMNYSGKFSHLENYLEHDNREIVSSLHDLAKSSFSLTWFKDNFDYTGSRASVFENIYENSDGASRLGRLVFSYRRYLFHGLLPLSFGGNMGLGYSKGQGYFVGNGQTSEETRFVLWTIPVDMAFSLDLSFWQWIKMSVSAGPSIMALWQSRSDFTWDDDKKHRRQIRTGGFVSGKVQLNLSKIFPSVGIRMLSNNRVSGFFLNLEMRREDYSAKDSFAVSGVSYGIGFGFDFL